MLTTPSIHRFIPLTKWNQFYPDPSVSGLRWLVFSNPEFNRRCTLRRGKRVLIDVEAYHRWLEEQNPDRELVAKGRGARS
jgi:hypothetical protein